MKLFTQKDPDQDAVADERGYYLGYQANISYGENLDLKDDDYLWRYFDLKGFMSFICTKSLFLRRIDRFEDSFEGRNLLLVKEQRARHKRQPETEGLGKILFSGPLGFLLRNPLTDREEELKRIEEVSQKLLYINCWHKNNRESPLMWAIYSSHEGIAVRIRFKDLKLMLDSAYVPLPPDERVSLHFDKVTYIDSTRIEHMAEEDLIRECPFGMTKDEAYEHENEYRLLAKAKNVLYDDEDEELVGIELPVRHSLTPMTAFFHPKAERWYCRKIEALVKRLEPELSLDYSKLEFR